MPTLKGAEASLPYVQCFLHLVSSATNVSVFHIAWLDTFWRDLVITSTFLGSCLFLFRRHHRTYRLSGFILLLHSPLFSETWPRGLMVFIFVIFRADIAPDWAVDTQATLPHSVGTAVMHVLVLRALPLC